MAEPVAATLLAPCKINLHLRILELLPDGMHALETVFYPLREPCDALRFAPGEPGAGLRLRCSRPELAGEGNLVARAWRAFGSATGFSPDLDVFLEKRIPVGAGLGGGSSDAAATLNHLNNLAGSRALSEERMVALAKELGADVAFFLRARPALAHGVGERLQEVAVDLSGLHLALICPKLHVSTAWAYGAWDAAQAGAGERAERLHGGLTARAGSATKSVFSASIELYNSFEGVVFPAHPELRALKERALRAGAAGALMSGSGASLFALFRELENARALARDLRKDQIDAYVHSF